MKTEKSISSKNTYKRSKHASLDDSLHEIAEYPAAIYTKVTFCVDPPLDPMAPEPPFEFAHKYETVTATMALGPVTIFIADSVPVDIALIMVKNICASLK